MIYSFAVLFYGIAVFSVCLGLFVLLNNRKASANQIWAMFTLIMALAFFSFVNVLVSRNKADALFWNKLLYIGFIFLPVFFLHFVVEILNIYNQKRMLLFYSYLSSMLLVFVLIFTSSFVKDMVPKLGFNFWTKGGTAYPLFSAFFFTVVIYIHYLLVISLKSLAGYKRDQIKYLLIACLIGFSGGISNFLLNFDIPVYPYGNYLIPVSLIIISYAIVRHKLMDIETIFHRTLAFIMLSSIILILYTAVFALAHTLLKGILDIHSPLVFLVFLFFFRPLFDKTQEWAERIFYREKYDYREVLKEFVKEIETLVQLDELLGAVVKTISETLHIEKASVMLLDEVKGEYAIEECPDLFNNNLRFTQDSPFIQWLMRYRRIVEREQIEINPRYQDVKDMVLENLRKMEAEVCIPLILKRKLIGMLNLGNRLSGEKYKQTDLELLSLLGGEISVAIENAKLYTQLKGSFIKTLHSLVEALDAKDPKTSGHSNQVCRYAMAIGRSMGLSDDQMERIKIAALLHDIGKIGVSEAILLKPGKLNEEEWAQVIKHSEISEKILKPLGLPDEILSYIRHHHERYNGEGYPDKKRGEDIPLGARILCVADAFEAMIAERPYRRAMSKDEAVAELKRCSGTQFDPEIVNVLLKIVDRIESLISQDADVFSL